ncbi:EAL domain-containing protein [Spirochaeta dissipatitropha]
MAEKFTPKVLVVDDSIASRKMVCEILRDLHVDIIEAEDGEEAVGIALEVLPDLILMDYRMPKMDGPEAVALIRQHPLAARIPMLMITGETDSSKMISSFESGVLDYIHKPFDRVQLGAQIRSYLKLAEVNRKFVLATIDHVTSRPNLLALHEDVENENGANPLLFLRSKEVSAVRRLYGTQIGNNLEIALCGKIEEIASQMFQVECVLYVIDRGAFVLRFLDNNRYIDMESAPTIMRTFEHHLSDAEFEVNNLLFTCDFRLVVSLAGDDVLSDGLVAFEDGRDLHIGPDIVFANEVVAEHRQSIHNNLQTLTTIRNSLREDHVISYVQPLVDLRNSEVIGYECLMRIRDSSGVILTPYQFLGVAKNSRYYPEMTIYMLNQACRAFSSGNLYCSINYSIVDIENERVVNHTLQVLKNNPEFARNLIIELVEQEDRSDFDRIGTFIRQIKACGARAAIDDFGSGYSNLRRVIELDFDYLKIDGSLVKDIVVNERVKRLVSWVVTFAEQAGMKVIAEFVESEAHQKHLLDMGVNFGQGYHFGRPEALDVRFRS